jgi:hypothetical protein
VRLVDQFNDIGSESCASSICDDDSCGAEGSLRIDDDVSIICRTHVAGTRSTEGVVDGSS